MSPRDAAFRPNGDPAAPTTTTPAFRVVFFLGCLLTLVPVWLTVYPPMVDLPQHAAQVGTCLRWESQDFEYSSHYWVNWRTPYLLPGAAACGLSQVLPVSVSFQVLISLALLGMPLATFALVRETRGSPWWVLTTLPVGYSFAFFMGFFSFVVATPIALFALLVALRYARAPRWLGGVGILVLLHVLFFTHLLVYGWAGLVGALIVLRGSPTTRELLRRWIPFLAALPLAIGWLLMTLWTEPTTQGLGFGNYGWHRVTELPAQIVGWPTSPVALAVGACLILLPFLLGGRITSDRFRWIPFLVSLSLYLLAPFAFLGTAFLYQRFAVLLIPTLLLALDAPSAGRHRVLARSLLVAVPVLWLAFLGIRFWGYDAESRELRVLIDSAKPDQRLLYLAFDRHSEFLPYPIFLHSGLWYQAERGGLADFSFARYFPNRFRYHEEAEPPLPGGVEWEPWQFDWNEHGGDLYDYLLVRSHADPTAHFARMNAPLSVVGESRAGWWLLAREDTSEGASANPSDAPTPATTR